MLREETYTSCLHILPPTGLLIFQYFGWFLLEFVPETLLFTISSILPNHPEKSKPDFPVFSLCSLLITELPTNQAANPFITAKSLRNRKTSEHFSLQTNHQLDANLPALSVIVSKVRGQLYFWIRWYQFFLFKSINARSLRFIYFFKDLLIFIFMYMIDMIFPLPPYM